MATFTELWCRAGESVWPPLPSPRCSDYLPPLPTYRASGYCTQESVTRWDSEWPGHLWPQWGSHVKSCPSPHIQRQRMSGTPVWGMVSPTRAETTGSQTAWQARLLSTAPERDCAWDSLPTSTAPGLADGQALGTGIHPSRPEEDTATLRAMSQGACSPLGHMNPPGSPLCGSAALGVSRGCSLSECLLRTLSSILAQQSRSQG